MRDDGLKCGDQPGPGGAQFVVMCDRKLFQKCFAAARKAKIDLSAVASAARAANPASSFEPAAQFDGRVMPDLQALGERADRGLDSQPAPLDREERLVLLRFDSGGAGGRLAKVQEAADFVAEVG